jgi:hypothetical protein
MVGPRADARVLARSKLFVRDFLLVAVSATVHSALFVSTKLY